MAQGVHTFLGRHERAMQIRVLPQILVHHAVAQLAQRHPLVGTAQQALLFQFFGCEGDRKQAPGVIGRSGIGRLQVPGSRPLVLVSSQ